MEKIEAVFKCKDPKKYIQVKTSKINEGTQLIVFCSDITQIKEVEKREKKMRSTFFSSIAHELRTPLNSIIPILIMVLDLIPRTSQKIYRYLQIVLNSSIHLQNVIEDALDISRIENNKFQLFMDQCDLRKAVHEVCDIMRFQFEQKKLGFDLVISD